jgi:predicted ester cyclase
MNTETNKAIVREIMERGFNQADLSIIDEYHDRDGVDHQEPLGTDFIAHLKDIIVKMHEAFPDLHFEIHEILAEGEIVAFRSTMTGTHSGLLSLVPGRPLPATGRKIAVPHMHFVRIVNGKAKDLWHVWNMPLMMQQLGIMPQQQPMGS